MLTRRAGCLRVVRTQTQQQQRAALSTLRVAGTTSGVLTSAAVRKPAALQRVLASSPALSRKAFHASSVSLDIQTVKVPNVAESITEGTLKTWTKKVGDSVEVDEEVATIETDKVDVSVNATHAGKIVELLANEEDTVEVGADLFRIEEGAAGESSSPKEDAPKKDANKESDTPTTKDEPVSEKPTQEETKPSTPSSSDAKPPPSKDESKPKDDKPKKEDKPKKDEKPKKDDKPAPKSSGSAATGPGSRNETRVKMNRMRLRIAERLKESQNAAAFLTTFNEIDMSSIKEFRSLYKDEVLKEHGVKLGFMSAFAKASALALKEIPAANASIVGDEIVYRDYVDLSVAVATPKGLVTPVVRNLETMNFVEIEQSIAGLGKKARDNQLTLEDMAGGTFTISNGGVFGSLYGTPIINLPQSAVLGMHAINDKPVAINGKVEIRPIMVVALTYDHRLLDGREAVTFLVRVKQYLEDPRKMLLKV